MMDIVETSEMMLAMSQVQLCRRAYRQPLTTPPCVLRILMAWWLAHDRNIRQDKGLAGCEFSVIMHGKQITARLLDQP